MSNGGSAIVLRSEVRPVATYTAYRDNLRLDFWYSCAYCSLAESEALGYSFEIDHYYPVATFKQLEKEYSNLYYSCNVCNRKKGALVPHPTDDARRLIRIDQENPLEHLARKGVRIEGTTPKGVHHVERLELNRGTLTRLRDIRQRLAMSSAEIAVGVHGILAAGLDRFPANHRGSIVRGRAKLKQRLKALTEARADFIRSRLRSPLIDAELATTRKRRRYLEENERALVHKA